MTKNIKESKEWIATAGRKGVSLGVKEGSWNPIGKEAHGTLVLLDFLTRGGVTEGSFCYISLRHGESSLYNSSLHFSLCSISQWRRLTYLFGVFTFCFTNKNDFLSSFQRTCMFVILCITPDTAPQPPHKLCPMASKKPKHPCTW